MIGSAQDQLPDHFQIFFLIPGNRLKICHISGSLEFVQKQQDKTLVLFLQDQALHGKDNRHGLCLFSAQKLVPELLLVSKFAGNREHTFLRLLRAVIVGAPVQDLRHRSL